MTAAVELALEGVSPHELGWRHSVAVDERTGAVAVDVPIPLTPGRNGFGPALRLTYGASDEGALVGDAWGLAGLPSIGHYTREGLPRYDTGDRFEWGGEELIPMLEGGTPRTFRRGDYVVECFRPRLEKAPVRVERWRHSVTSAVHFRVREPDGTVSVFGRRSDGESRIEDAPTGRVWRWLLEARFEPRGDALWVRYLSEGGARTGDPVAGPATIARYPKRVLYGNAAPVAEDAELEAATWRFEAVLDYGDHRALSPEADPAAPVRPDPRSSGRAGFEVRWSLRCQRILMFHRFPLQLNTAAMCVGVTEIAYGDDHMIAELRYTGGRVDAGRRTERSLQPLRFRYSSLELGDAFEDLPEAADRWLSRGTRLVDLFGEGVPGLLTETAGACHYARALGDGRFAPREPLREWPNGGAGAIADFDADGDGELFVDRGRFHRMDRNRERWQPSRTLARLAPDAGPLVQRIDLDGDGRADLVAIDQHGLTYWPNLGEQGFGEAVRVPLPADRLPQAAPSLGRFLADMTGDGLADLVEIRNGSITYWPGLGHGRFGDPVVMDGVPRFDHEGAFSPDRLYLIDLSGTGTTDLLYLRAGELELWFNDHGRGFRSGGRIHGLPPLGSARDLQIADVTADGTISLVWAPSTGEPDAPLRALRLQRRPPRQLVAVEDAFGTVIELEYESSARQYLRDRESGQGWTERAPSHRQVVVRRSTSERVAPDDQLGGARSVVRYIYRDATYDGHERRFVGFARVDRIEGAPHPALSSPATLTRSIRHTGSPSFGRDGGADFYGTGLDPPAPPPDWSSDDYADGLSALAGSGFQTEVYAAFADDVADGPPLRVECTKPAVRRLAPSAPDRRAVLALRPREQLAVVLDALPDDPRRAHSMVLEDDEFGHARLSLDVGYPRSGSASPRVDAQHDVIARSRMSRPIHVDTDLRFQLGALEEVATFQVALPLPGALIDPDGVAGEVRRAVDAPMAYDDAPLSRADDGVTRARPVSRKQVLYWDDAGSGPLALGGIGAVTLVHHDRDACFEDAWLRDVLGPHYDADLLQRLSYRLAAQTWWRDGPTQLYEPADRFHRSRGTQRSDGATRRLEYDDDALVLAAVIDAAGNRTSAEIDFCTMRPWQLEDANGTVAEVARDPLGVVVRRSAYGAVRGPSGERTEYGHAPIDPAAPIPSPDEAVAQPEAALAGNAEVVAYDLESEPRRVVTLKSERLAAPRTDEPRAEVNLAYFDGRRRTLQTKQRVDDGPAFERAADGTLGLVESGAGPRWRTSGHVVYDSRDRPVREHHPYHSRTPDFEGDPALWTFGSAKTQHFDAVGRVVHEDQLNGAVVRTEHDPWAMRAFDANDTVEEAGNAYRAARAALDPASDEGFALARSRVHAATPTTTALDPLGRAVAVDQRLGARTLRTTTERDGHDEPSRVRDPRRIIAHQSRRDMLGRALLELSADAGPRWLLPDAFDRPAHGWTAEEMHRETTFDGMDRPTEVTWEHAGGRRVAERLTYGETVADGRERNALGRLLRHEDQAGVTEIEAYDPTGAVLRARRRLTVTPEPPNWAAEVDLEPPFDSATSYDGLGRWVEKTLADGTVRRRRFLRGGELGEIDVVAGERTHRVLSGARYDAFGRRIEALLGNGVVVIDTYDRITQLLVRSVASGLQNVERYYDASGRLVRMRDLAQEPGGPGALPGQTVPAHRDHYYDTLYRLVRATGRYHRALQQDDHRTDVVAPDTYRGTRHVNDGTQVTRYQQRFEYDDGGNLLRIVHGPEAGYTGSTWTTEKWVSDTSNRQLPAFDHNGIAWGRPEMLFDREGRCLQLATVEAIAWDPTGPLARATVIHRPGGTDDDERYQYGADGARVRKVRRRVIHRETGLVETTEVITFEGGELTRIDVGTDRMLVRWSSRIDDDRGRDLATLHRWERDVGGRETGELERATGRLRFSLCDDGGSVTHELDDAGGRVTYEEYFPYGSTSYLSGDVLRDVPTRTLRYAGKTQDDATGLYYFEFRYYAPYLGNWLSPDPAGLADGVNLYQFVRGDPINNSDPDGLCTRSRSEVVTSLYKRFMSGAEPYTYDPSESTLYRRIDRSRDERIDSGEFADYLARTGNGSMLQDIMLARGGQQEAEVARQQRIGEENNLIWEEGVRQAQAAEQAPQPDAPPTYVDIGILRMGGRIEIVRFDLPAGDEHRVRELYEESARLHNEDVAARQAVGEAILNGITLGISGIISAEREDLERGVAQIEQGDYAGGLRTLGPALGRMVDPIHQTQEAIRGIAGLPGAFRDWSHIQSQNLVQDANTSGNGIDIRRLDYQGNTPEERVRMQQLRGQAGSLHLQVLGEMAGGLGAPHIPGAPDIPDAPNVPRRRVPDAPDAPGAANLPSTANLPNTPRAGAIPDGGPNGPGRGAPPDPPGPGGDSPGGGPPRPPHTSEELAIEVTRRINEGDLDRPLHILASSRDTRFQSLPGDRPTSGARPQYTMEEIVGRGDRPELRSAGMTVETIDDVNQGNPGGQWSRPANEEWIRRGTDEGAIYMLASPRNERTMRAGPEMIGATSSFYAREISDILATGNYRLVGWPSLEFLVPVNWANSLRR